MELRMRWLQSVIGRPQQAHGVQSAEEYRRRARAFLLKHGLSPMLIERKERPVAYVSDGRWVIDCDCGNGPSASPEWGIAICLECGSMYAPAFPDGLAEVEHVLLKRQNPLARHFFPGDLVARQHGVARAETVDDLRRENRRHGLED